MLYLNFSLHQAQKYFGLKYTNIYKAVFAAMYGKMPSANIGYCVIKMIIFY